MIRTKYLVQIIIIFTISCLIPKRTLHTTYVKKIKRFENDFRHILIWTDLPGVTKYGQVEFTESKCERNTCFLTKNRTLFKDIGYFDAIIFNLQEVSRGANDLPQRRGSFQKYIFAANDSAEKFPVCHPMYDDFFNWTWTYRRYSTIAYRYVHVKTISGSALYGEINWRPLYTMNRIDRNMMNILSTKNKAAAIFLDECISRSKRELFVMDLEKELSKFNLTIDIFGDCGRMKCKKRSIRPCNYRIRKDYYFFLALEDSIDEDYVTDIVMHAYKNNAVPVVRGGADYLYFMPEHSYLDASQFTIQGLAEKMHQLTIHKHQYYDMFRWKNYYVMEQAPPLELCSLCEALTTPKMLIHKDTFDDFRKWWNPNFKTRCKEELF